MRPLLCVVAALGLAVAACGDTPSPPPEGPSADRSATTARSEATTTTAEATATTVDPAAPGQVTPPPGITQAQADAFARAVTDAYAADDTLPDSLVPSVDLLEAMLGMAQGWCAIADQVAATYGADPETATQVGNTYISSAVVNDVLTLTEEPMEGGDAVAAMWRDAMVWDTVRPAGETVCPQHTAMFDAAARTRGR